MSTLGRLAGGLAGGIMAEGARQIARGNRPAMRDMILTPGNITRVTHRLSELRGAAMKVGQLISMDSGQLLPQELSEILSQLRSQANTMPTPQLRDVLEEAWGSDWQARFSDFDFRPIASASIGQVHRAVTVDGRHLAIKVQYPGVAASIDSDVDNVATLLRISRLLPAELDLAPLLAEAKQQLHGETDYLQEAAALNRFREWLASEPGLSLPTVYDDLTCSNVLAMSFRCGRPVDQMVTHCQQSRDQVIGQLLELLFRELFEFGEVQTDPNAANYLFDGSSRELILLDFGATRAYGTALVAGYRALLSAALHADREAMFEAARQIGYFSDQVTPAQRETVLDLFTIATEPLRHDGVYDFGKSDLATRIREKGLQLSMEQAYWHSPPVDALFLHRKLAGLYLLANRLGARLDLLPLRRWLDDSTMGVRPSVRGA